MTWLILGLLFGAGFFWLATRPNFKLRWYEWLLMVLAVILILFAVQNYQASMVELERRAASILLWMFGLPGLILGVLAVVLAWMRNRKAA